MESPEIRKFAALVHKTFGEFASIHSYNETGKLELYTHELTDPKPEDVTIELVKGYYEQHDLVLEGDYSIEDLIVKRYDYIEEGVLGADIRNKLSPIKNLLTLLTIYKDQKHAMDWDHKEYFEKQIIALIEECKESVIYLSELI